jgi:iron complex outermembrane receptor protein
MKPFFKLLPLSIAVAAMASQAQENAGIEELSLDEIIVTATRKETSLQDTAVAVTAISADVIQDRNIVDFRDVAKYSPGVSIGSRPGRAGTAGSITIRGIGVDSFDSAPSVGIYVDEAYYTPQNANVMSLMDVERVEVLRGPQGTTFGRNTIAGAVQYVTKAPSTEGLEGYVRGTVGNFDRKDIQAALNIPLTDTFAARIAAMSNERDGFVKDLLNDVDRGADEVTGGRLRLRWEPVDRLTMDLKYETIEQQGNGRAVEVTAVEPNAQFAELMRLFSGFTTVLDDSVVTGEDYTNAGFNDEDSFDYEAEIVQAMVNYDINDNISVKYIFADSHWETDLLQDFDSTPLPILFNRTFPDARTDQTTHEIQLSGTAFDDRFSYIAGYHYTDIEALAEWTAQISIGGLPLNPNFGKPLAKTDAQALYFHSTYDINDQLSATVGVRYTEDELSSELVGTIDQDPTSATFGQLVDVTAPIVKEFDNTSAVLGLDYQINDDVMVYAKVAEGFRAGGFNANKAIPGGGAEFEPEEAITYEFGARMDLLDGRLRFNPTIFHTKWDDMQVNVPVVTPSGPAVLVDNAGDAEITGLELETQFLLSENVTMFAAFAYLDAKYTRIDSTVVTSSYPNGFLDLPNFDFTTTPPTPAFQIPVVAPDITKDTELMLTPEFKFTIGTQVDFTLAGTAMSAIVDYAWVDDQRSSPFESGGIEMESHGLLNARVRADVIEDQLTVAIFGTNLTDERYLIGGQDFAAGYTVGNRDEYPGRPREYGLEVTYNF